MVDKYGRAIGNILPEFNLSERAEAAGASAIPTAERIVRVQEDPRFGTDQATSANQFYPNISQVPDQPSYIGGTTLGATTTNDPGTDRIISGGGGGGGTGTPTDGGGGFDFSSMLNMAREQARRTAGQGYDRARGIVEEGRGILARRRGEFSDLFNQGNEDILQSYEGERGNLQTSSQGARTRMANAMRALGLGGSAFVKSEGRQAQNEAKALGGLGMEKQVNERENRGQFNERNLWADTQEASLQRALEDANNVRGNVESSADINYLNDIGGLFSRILENQQAINAASGNYTANPYQTTMTSLLGALNGGTPSLGGGAGTVQNVSLQEQDPTLALLKKRSGVAGAGLYA